MPPRTDNLIVVLDIGSAWTRVLAADVNEGAARYRGHGIVESAGMRKGLIGELGPASRAVPNLCPTSAQPRRLIRAGLPNLPTSMPSRVQEIRRQALVPVYEHLGQAGWEGREECV